MLPKVMLPETRVTCLYMLSYVGRSYNSECMCYRSKLNLGEVFITLVDSPSPKLKKIEMR